VTFADIAPFLTSVTGLITVGVSVWNLRATKKVVQQTNHIKDELVAEVRKASFASGQKDQKENPGQ
jgi:hypothetical protein